MFVDWFRLLVALKLRALINPAVAADLTRVWWRYRRRRWWARAPFIPWPDRTYLRWRMYTAYGSEDAVPSVADVLRYARWTRHHP
jgi:hypothetical protein